MVSVYKNLSEILVEQDNMIKMGAPLGKTGNTGYTFKNGVEVMTAIDGVYINPFSNYNYGISY